MSDENYITSKYCIIDLPSSTDESQLLKGRIFISEHHKNELVGTTEFPVADITATRFDIFHTTLNAAEAGIIAKTKSPEQPSLQLECPKVIFTQELDDVKEIVMLPIKEERTSNLTIAANAETDVGNSTQDESDDDTDNNIPTFEEPNQNEPTKEVQRDVKHVTKIISDATAALKPTGIFPKRIKRKKSKSKKKTTIKTPIDYSLDLTKDVENDENDRYYDTHNKPNKRKDGFKIITDNHAGQDKLINAVASLVVIVLLTSLIVVIGVATLKYSRVVIAAISTALQ